MTKGRPGGGIKGPYVGGGGGQSFTLQTTTTAGGTVTMNPPGGQYERGSAVTLTAVPADGYTFAGWTIDGAAVAENPTVVHVQHLTVAAAAFVVEP